MRLKRHPIWIHWSKFLILFHLKTYTFHRKKIGKNIKGFTSTLLCNFLLRYMSFSWNYFALTTKKRSYNAIQSSPRMRCYSPVKRHFNKYAFSLVKNNIFFKNNKVLTSQTVAILYVNVCIVFMFIFGGIVCLLVFDGVRLRALIAAKLMHKRFLCVIFVLRVQ